MRIAYLINQYPKVSHSFIRREILELERQGVEVQRIALRGWDAELVDAVDRKERERTNYVLKKGIFALVIDFIRVLLTEPLRLFKAFIKSVKMGIRADRPWFYHLIYLAEACRIIPWIKHFDATHIHAHFGTNSAEIAMLVHMLSGVRYSFTVHGPEEFDKPQFIHIKEKVELAAFVVAISSYGRSQLYRWIDYDQWRKIKVVRCGLDREFYEVSSVPIPVSPRLVCVGRLAEQKAQLLLIEAAKQLRDKNVEFELVLAGDGEMRAEIERLISIYDLNTSYDLNTRISITGWITSEQVREQILNAQGLILPSFAEGLPVVIMEAMALKRPVLSTYVAGIPELVKHGENGWLFAAGSVDRLVAAIEEFLKTPVASLQTMGELGFSAVMEQHSIEVEVKKLITLVQEAGGR